MNEHFDNLFADKVRDSFNELEVGFSESSWQQFLLKEKKAAKISPLLTNRILKFAAVFLIIAGVGYSFRMIVTDSELRKTDQNQKQIVESNEQKNPPNNAVTNGVDSSEVPSATQQFSEIKVPSESIAESNIDPEKQETTSVDSSKIETSTSSIGFAVVEQINFNMGDSEGANEKLRNKSTVIVDGKNYDEPMIFIPKARKSRFNEIEFHASSLTNYSEADPTSSLNYSGGISSEVQLTNRIGFSSGLTVAKQALEIENNGLEITTESELSETGISTFADLVTLDIPLNVRYYLNQDKEAYFSLGISSFLYLQESFTTTFSQVTELTIEKDGEQITFRQVDEVNNTRSEEAFSRFDFAKTVNVSMGFQYSLSDKLGLIFEPYAKIPIAPLTSEQVRFGSGGLQVRFQLRN